MNMMTKRLALKSVQTNVRAAGARGSGAELARIYLHMLQLR